MFIVVLDADRRAEAVASASWWHAMSEQAQPDVESIAPPRRDSYGQAAYLLVESLIHELISQSVLNVDDAVQVVSIAAEVEEVLCCIDDANAPSAAFKLLQTLQASLELDR